jgi:hypothetical protein
MVDWSPDDPTIAGTTKTFRRGESQALDYLIDQRDPDIEELGDGNYRAHPEALARANNPTIEAGILFDKLRLVKRDRKVRDDQLRYDEENNPTWYSHKNDRYECRSVTWQADYDKHWRSALKKGYPKWPDAVKSRLEADEEYLVNMVLRDVTSERPEIHNPGIQGKAIEVAKAKGSLGAIYAYYATLSKGAEATDTCGVMQEPPDSGFYAWMFMLFIFVMGMALGLMYSMIALTFIEC